MLPDDVLHLHYVKLAEIRLAIAPLGAQLDVAYILGLKAEEACTERVDRDLKLAMSLSGNRSATPWRGERNRG
jgi:hypothetical protein